MSPTARTVIALLKMIPMNCLFHTFANLVALLYCHWCYHCYMQLQRLSHEVKTCLRETFLYPKQIELLQLRRRAIDQIEDLQRNFSFISFLVCIVNFTMCFSSLGSYLWLSENSYPFVTIDAFYTTFNCLMSLSAIFVVAGQVPIEMENFTNEFLKKFEHRFFLEPSQDNTRVLEWLLKKPDLVLSGCKVISYRRSSVLTAVGTILTYGLLVVNMETRNTKCDKC
ncbi:uncharacterized protein TNCT_399101 [Trichonephila clavata]|uniref:Gustatory receptor n=1 Tax=Trichonephila clavata TaxID=2740835 RepID=A0A8X6LX81_TRICU|nr:uncharacterized protein TNCT_399101 [Trichonephila clavata]